MRKSLIAAAVAALALAGASVVYATGVVTQHYESGVSPSKAGTVKKPKPVALKLHLFVTTSDGSVPPAANHDLIYFATGIALNSTKFKSCALETLNDSSKGPSACPAGSKIGGGTAKAHIGSDPKGQDESITVTLFNGPKGKAVEIYLNGTSPAQIQGAFQAKLVPIRSGPFGLKLDTVIPKSLYEPITGLFTPLTDFNVSIKASTRVKGVSYGYVTTFSCPKSKKWPFKAIFNYANGSPPDTAKTTVSCSG